MKTIKLNIYRQDLKVTLADCEDGIILKIDPEMLRDNDMNVKISLLASERKKLSKQDITRKPIPGHPNCFVGDCYTCENVSCGIYQGYEEMPE